MAIVVLLSWCSLCAPSHNQRNFIKLEQVFCREKTEEGLESCSSLYYFQILRKERNQRTIENEEHSAKKLKCLYLGIYIIEGSMPFIVQIGWVLAKRKWCFFNSLFFFFCGFAFLCSLYASSVLLCIVFFCCINAILFAYKKSRVLILNIDYHRLAQVRAFMII